MANPLKAVRENIDGAFFVDTTCIDCDTCRQLAPDTFDDDSYVYRQPQTEQAEQAALEALLCCPTGSIGTRQPNQAKTVLDHFPKLVDGPVYYCGFTSPKSYGASSYLVVDETYGNWLIDSPKFLPRLVSRLEAMGGVRYLFLSHSDDVADAQRYAEHFGAQRVIHAQEVWAQPDSERVIEGDEAQEIVPGYVVIPTPGHTPGHCVLLVNDRYLFTGDHLWWEREAHALAMPRHYYWNRVEQVRSSEKLLAFRFEWVLPGHGQRIHWPAEVMRRHLQAMIERHQHLKA